MAAKAPTIVFFPEGAFGPTNNCVGHRRRAAPARRPRRVHRRGVVRRESRGEGVRGAPDAARAAAGRAGGCPGQFWKDFIRDTAPLFRKPTIEQLESFIQPTWQALIDGSKYVNGRLAEIFDEVQPDVIVEDNVVAFPGDRRHPGSRGRASSRATRSSCRDPDLPPVFSGYPTADRDGWREFEAEYLRTHDDMWHDFDAFVQESGAPRAAASSSSCTSRRI